MIVTLLVIYSIGLGNTAILTEKFQTKQTCEIAATIIKVNLDNKVEYVNCILETN